jgi:tRNA nucleotidyltransferase (CCA-adding enzyme)
MPLIDPIQIPPQVQGLFKKMAFLAARRHEAAYAVGGFVRDLLLGRSSSDVDIAVEGDGVAFARDFAKTVKGRCDGVTRFGTAIVVVPHFGKLDVASTRAESYSRPAVLPDVRPASLADDLKRRDFTLNSIAFKLRSDGRVDWIDPSGGREDLEKGLLRAHHAKTFEDDPTRIFRAARFEQRFSFDIDPATLEWLKDAAQRGFIERVTGERVHNELRLIFAEPHPEKAVKRLEELDVWRHLHPKLARPEFPKEIGASLRALERAKMENPWMVWFASVAAPLDLSQRMQLASRLMLSGDERTVLVQCGAPLEAARAALDQGRAPLSRVHLALTGLKPEVWAQLWVGCTPFERELVERYAREAGRRKPLLTGEDLISLGYKAGPSIARVLEEAEGLRLDGVLQDRKEALQWLKETRPPGPTRR